MNRDGVERSAVLLMALGEDVAAQVLRYLSPLEVAELARAMRESGPVPRARVQDVMQAYQREAVRQTGIGADADAFLDAALTRAVGDDQARQLLARLVGGSAEMQRLAWKDPAEIAALLRDQPAQIAALVLTRLERGLAAATLEWLPQTMQLELLQSVDDVQTVSPEVLRELDIWLAQALAAEHETNTSGEDLAADLFARLTPATRAGLEAELAKHDPQALGRLKLGQLEWHDLARLSGDARMVFFKAVPGQTLLLALKGADPELVEHLLSNMPATAAGRLRDDLDALGAVKLSDIENAQQQTVKLLRELVRLGQIAI